MEKCKHPIYSLYTDKLQQGVVKCGICHETVTTSISSIPVKAEYLEHCKLGEFEKTITPVIQYMNNFHPHHVLLITNTNAELLESKMGIHNDKFIKD